VRRPLYDSICANVTEHQKRTKDEAELMRLCLDYGLCSKADVIAWADREIETCDAPDPAVIDVALATRATTQDLLDLLAAVPGTSDVVSARAMFLGRVADALRHAPDTLPEVVRVLRRVALCGDAPDERASHAMRTLENDYELVVYAGRPETELRQRILTFLDEQAARAGRQTR